MFKLGARRELMDKMADLSLYRHDISAWGGKVPCGFFPSFFQKDYNRRHLNVSNQWEIKSDVGTQI